MPDILVDPTTDWLKYLEPFSSGLVVAASVLLDLGLVPEPQSALDTAAAAAVIAPLEEEGPALTDAWAFIREILGWEHRVIAGSPGGPTMPEALHVRLPEHDTTLVPTFAVRDLAVRESEAWQLLVRVEAPGVGPDTRGALDGWEATPQQRLERLLRETGIPAGILVTDSVLRLVYAPKGETSGWLGFPLRPLATVAGRPMLGGLKRVVGRAALFTDGDTHRLPAILRRSRDEQSNVSTELAGQVLGALHELLRGLDAADAGLIRGLTTTPAGQGYLYEGLLAVLMRLVFILYAEDRGLLPSSGEARAREIYERNYSLRGLYGRLAEDAGLHPDTMDERRGGWGQLIALFRIIHGGYPSFVRRRGGKLFDPDIYPFLEGRAEAGASARVLPLSDGCVLRVLEGLMTLRSRGGARERLSYRTLDVEQIGSVYETVMGFTVLPASGPVLAIKGGKNNRTPIYIDLAEIVTLKGEERLKRIKEAGRASLSAVHAKAVKFANSIADVAAALDGIVDERACPGRVVQAAGTPLLQPTDERRRSGSHYTPRSLTEPIVRYALEPTFERLGEAATPEQILDLKVCDPAMGSGAFLVEACRQLGARLVQAWAHNRATPVLPTDEDADLHARRLVAQRCLYGVDKNPRAVDLAKLSLWLATLAADHEFTFLDHALREGDSLIGLSWAQIAALHWDESKPPTLVGHLVSGHLREAEVERAAIRTGAEGMSEAKLRPRLRHVEAKLAVARLIGDGIIATHFSAHKPKKRLEQLVALQKMVHSHLGSAEWEEMVAPHSAGLASGQHPLRPFHWPIEFPEVFSGENPGFDVIVGNPPFMGGTVISAKIGMDYFEFLTSMNPGAGHHCDMAAYFLRRAYGIIRAGGSLGLVATNTIAQGDTREGGIAWILRNKGSILRATCAYKWPGDAAVVVNIIHILKNAQVRNPTLNDRKISRISAFLIAGHHDETPKSVGINPYVSLGSKIYGQGFLFSDTDQEASTLKSMSDLLLKYPDLSSRVIPYLGGEEVNSNPMHLGSRHVIYLSDLSNEEELTSYEPLAEIVRQKVMPERMKLSNNPNSLPLKRRWWAYQAHRPELYRRLKSISQAIVISQTTKYICFALVPSNVIFSQKLNVISSGEYGLYCCLSSRPHELWALQFGSTLEDRPVYTIADCYENFPLPKQHETSECLLMAGTAYNKHRAALMVARNEGMTKTYNRFHDRAEQSKDIKRLRELHGEMDRAVLAAYGWNDLAACAEAQWLDEENEAGHSYKGRLFWPSAFRDEVLARLLALNAERAAGIVAVRTEEADDEAA